MATVNNQVPFLAQGLSLEAWNQHYLGILNERMNGDLQWALDRNHKPILTAPNGGSVNQNKSRG